MAYRVETCSQIEAWDGVTANIPAYIEIVCDDVSDLPLSATTIVSGYEAVIGSLAHVVSNQLDYEMQSNGTWVVRQTADVQSLVTLVSQLQTDLTLVSNIVNDSMLPALRKAIDVGGRNMLLMDSVDGSSAGVTYTRTSEGYVTTSGTSTGASLWTVSTVTLTAGTELWLNGCPSGGDYYNGYSLFIAKNVSGASTLAHEEGNGIGFTVPETAEYRVRIVARNGTNMNNLRFLPQLLPAEFANSAFGDYYTSPAPENAFLYNLIRGYHP